MARMNEGMKVREVVRREKSGQDTAESVSCFYLIKVCINL